MGGVETVLALVAAVCFALAATLWQRASLDAGVEPGDPRGFLVLLTSWVWLLGLGAQIVGVVLQAAALDRGRVAIIQPLLVTSIVWALPLGALLTHQTVTAQHAVGAVVIVAGLAIFAIVGDPAAGVDDAQTSSWISAFVVLGAVCVALMLAGRRGGPGTTAAALGATAGVLYGVAATLMKPVVERGQVEGLVAAVAHWQLWVTAAAGIVGFGLQQMSLATGQLVVSVATVAVVNPVVSVALGALILQERLDGDPPWHAVVATGGLAVALLGTVVIVTASDRTAGTLAARRPPATTSDGDVPAVR